MTRPPSSLRTGRILPSFRLLSSASASSSPSSFSPLATPADDLRHCRELIRSRDYSAYLVGLLRPPSVSPAYFAVRALDAEAAGSEDSLLSGNAGSLLAVRMRLQWWSDALDAAYGDSAVPAHPVARVLRRERAKIPRRPLERLLDARRDEAETGGRCDSVEDLVRRTEDTEGALLRLHLAACDVSLATSKNYLRAVPHLPSLVVRRWRSGLEPRKPRGTWASGRV
uniref:Phytoene synthase n=1 Tax=Corethron hystrix TaxID=216773 RepID=A0A7S1BH05_9STRA